MASLFAFCVLFVGVFSGVLIWRLSQGPVSLNRFAPYILAELNKSSGDLKFDVEDMVLVWRGWEEKFDVRMRQISVRQANGREMLRMPAADVVFSSRALFDGVLALREIDLIAPRMRLVRYSDGRFDVGLSGDLANVLPGADEAKNTGVPDASGTILPGADGSPMPGADGTTMPGADGAATGTADHIAPDAVISPNDGDAAGTSGQAGDMTEQELVSGSVVMRRVVAILSGEAEDFPAAAYFESFGIYKADLKVEDRLLGVVWSAPDADIRLSRSPAGIDADMKMSVTAGEMTTDVSATASYSTRDQRIDLKTHISKVIPASLSTISSEFIGLDRFDLPVSGDFDVILGANGSVQNVVARLEAGAGRVQLPTPLNSVYDIDGGKATLIYVPGKLSFNDVKVQTGKIGLEMNSEIDHPLGNWAVQLNAAVTNVATDDLPNLWPETLGDNPREWVIKNLSGGGVQRAQIDLAMHRGPDGNAAIDHVNGDMTMSGIDVQYLPGMPKVTQAAGRAEFNANSFSIFVDSGAANGIKVDSAKLVFSSLDTDNEWANIDFVVHGGVRDAMNLIDHEPLGFAKKLGIDPKQLSGSQSTRVKLSFPLLSDLSFDDVEVAAASRIDKATVTKVFRDLDIADGNFELQVNTKGLELKGDAKLGQGQNTIDWVESFDDKTPLTSHYQLGGTFDLSALNNIGIDVSSFLHGTADGNVEIKVIRAGDVEVSGKTDIANSIVDIAEADYHKDVQTPGKLGFDVVFKPDGSGVVRNFDLTAPDVGILASGRWRGDNKLDDKVHFDLANGHFRQNSGLSGTLIVKDNGALQVDLTGDQIDLRRFLTANGRPKDAAASSPTGQADDTAVDNGAGNSVGQTLEFPTIKINLEAKRFYAKGDNAVIENGKITYSRLKDDSEIEVVADRFDARPWLVGASSDGKGGSDGKKTDTSAETAPKGPESGGIGEQTSRRGGKKKIFLDVGELLAARDQVVTAVKGSIHVEGDEWRSIVLNGKLNGTADVFAQVEPVAGGKRKVQVTTDDAGRFLAAIDLYGDLREGKMKVQGLVDDRKYSQPFTGTAHIDNFRIVNAPLGARVLNAASLLGLVDSLQGKGIIFDAMDGEFTYSNDVLSLTKVAANGAAIGVTANGSIDLATDEIRIAGSIVPFYALNSVLGKIPLIGDLLVGEEGGGVFAPTYTVEGAVENPNIVVNPLSTIVPGVFRNLITGAKPG